MCIIIVGWVITVVIVHIHVFNFIYGIWICILINALPVNMKDMFQFTIRCDQVLIAVHQVLCNLNGHDAGVAGRSRTQCKIHSAVAVVRSIIFCAEYIPLCPIAGVT